MTMTIKIHWKKLGFLQIGFNTIYYTHYCFSPFLYLSRSVALFDRQRKIFEEFLVEQKMAIPFYYYRWIQCIWNKLLRVKYQMNNVCMHGIAPKTSTNVVIITIIITAIKKTLVNRIHTHTSTQKKLRLEANPHGWIWFRSKSLIEQKNFSTKVTVIWFYLFILITTKKKLFMIVAILSFSTVSLLLFKTYSPNPASVVCEWESSFRTHFRLESVLWVDVNGITCQS